MKFVSLADLQEQQVTHNPMIRKRVMIPPAELGRLVYFSQAVFPSGEVARAHRHATMDEVFFVQSGKGEMIVEDRRINWLPGVCIMVEAGEEHEVCNTGKEELVITYFGISTD